MIKCKITYKEKLNKEAKLRYLEKIKTINKLDPYEHKEWSSDLNKLPHVTFPDVCSYLFCGVSAYTFEQFKNDKSLEAHLQKYKWMGITLIIQDLLFVHR